jgi:hypothetical protein
LVSYLADTAEITIYTESSCGGSIEDFETLALFIPSQCFKVEVHQRSGLYVLHKYTQAGENRIYGSRFG